MTPSVPEILAVQVIPTRRAALITPRVPLAVPQHRGHLLVDPGVAEDTLGCHVLDRAEQQRAQLERVDPEVEQPAATEVQAKEPVLRIQRPAKAEVGLDEYRLADPATGDDVDQVPVGGEEPAPDGLHEEQSSAPSHLDHFAGLAGVERQRLLTEHVLARLQEHQGVLDVSRLGRCDVHDVDLVDPRPTPHSRRSAAERRTDRRRPRRDPPDREATATISPPSTIVMASPKPTAMAPGPITPQRIMWPSLLRPSDGPARTGVPDHGETAPSW